MNTERSVGSLVMAIVAIALIGVSFTMPWWSYDYSSGRRTPYGGFHPANETGVISHSLEASPGEYQGDVASADPDQSERIVTWSAWALYGALGLTALAAIGELPGAARVIVRRIGLALLGGAFVAVCVALWLLWFQFPDSVGNGVDGPFTSYQDSSGYTMTEIRAGWIVAALAIPALFGAFLFKFQAGPPDPAGAAIAIAKEES